MNNKTILILLSTLTLFSLVCKGQQSGTLTFRLTDFESSNGSAVVNLFREQDDIPQKPFKTLTAPIQDGVATLTISDIPFVEFAAIAYHDENGNGALDHWMGFPNEPMGFSNNWNLSLFSGMPTFKKLKFKFAGEDAPVEIKID